MWSTFLSPFRDDGRRLLIAGGTLLTKKNLWFLMITFKAYGFLRDGNLPGPPKERLLVGFMYLKTFIKHTFGGPGLFFQSYMVLRVENG